MVPDPNILDPNDIEALQQAEESIGNYRLRSDAEFVANGNDVATAAKKYKELIRVKEEIHLLRSDYNDRIFGVQQKRNELCQFVEAQNRLLKQIHEEVPKNKIQCLERMPTIDDDIDIPEAFVNYARPRIDKDAEQIIVACDESHDCTRIIVDSLKNYQCGEKSNGIQMS